MLPPFESSGSGAAVVLAHGSEMDRTMFAPQVQQLSAEGRRAISIDHRARTKAGLSEYSLYDLAEDIRELLDELQIERCVFVGMSMGGFVGLRAAIRFPERLAGLAIIGGAMHRPYPESERAHWLRHYAELRGLDAVPEAFALGQAPVCFSKNARQSDPQLVSEWVDRWCAHNGEAVYQEARSWIVQDDISAEVARIAVPTLIIQGNEDSALPTSDALSTFKLLENATMVRLPGVGHTANLEDPITVNRLLGRFVDDVSRTR